MRGSGRQEGPVFDSATIIYLVVGKSNTALAHRAAKDDSFVVGPNPVMDVSEKP